MAYSFDIATVGSPKILRLHAYWDGLRRGRPLPSRMDIDPAAIKTLLPNILLMDITPDPFRVRYRLVGTAVAEHARCDYTGMYLDQLDFGAHEPEDWFAFYRLISDHRCPLFGRSAMPFETPTRDAAPFEFCILPLSNDGTGVTGAIALEDYEPLSLHERDQLEKVIRRGSTDPGS